MLQRGNIIIKRRYNKAKVFDSMLILTSGFYMQSYIGLINMSAFIEGLRIVAIFIIAACSLGLLAAIIVRFLGGK